MDVSSSEMEAAADNVLDWRAGWLASRGVGLAVLDISPGRRAGAGFTPEDSRDVKAAPVLVAWGESLDGSVHRRSADAEEFGQFGSV